MRLLPFRGSWAVLAAVGVGVLVAAQVTPVEISRAVESVLPALVYGGSCWSEIELRNLSDRAVTVEVEGRRASGALVGLAGLTGNVLRMAPQQRGKYRLEIPEETIGAWVKVRERPPPGASQSVAVSATSECIAGEQVRTVRRDVAFPQNNPWFDSAAAALADGVVSLINTSGASVLARVCYSAGNLYSVPAYGRAGSELTPICSIAFDVPVAPFGAREFPVAREGSTHFTLRTAGRGIVLEMLRPVDASVRMYRVDSTIRFGGEAPGPGRR